MEILGKSLAFFMHSQGFNFHRRMEWAIKKARIKSDNARLEWFVSDVGSLFVMVPKKSQST